MLLLPLLSVYSICSYIGEMSSGVLKVNDGHIRGKGSRRRASNSPSFVCIYLEETVTTFRLQPIARTLPWSSGGHVATVMLPSLLQRRR